MSKKTRKSCELIDPKPLQSKPLHLSKEELKDLNSLLPYINETSRLFYNLLMQHVKPTLENNDEEDLSD